MGREGVFLMRNLPPLYVESHIFFFIIIYLYLSNTGYFYALGFFWTRKPRKLLITKDWCSKS